MMKNNITTTLSVKDLKKGDYIYNEVVTNEGTFGYVSIFKEISNDGKFREIVTAGRKMPNGHDDETDNLYYNTNGDTPTTIRMATQEEIDYLDNLLDADGHYFWNGELK